MGSSHEIIERLLIDSQNRPGLTYVKVFYKKLIKRPISLYEFLTISIYVMFSKSPSNQKLAVL